jgi:hypothetical protein
VYRALNVVGLVLFLYAAAVQANDPDPMRWLFVYGLTAVWCGWAVARGVVPLKLTLPWAILTASLVFPLLRFAPAEGHLMPGFPAWGPLREETVRESIGLALCSLWSASLAAHAARRRALGAAVEDPSVR